MSCAIGEAVLDVIEDDNLQAHALEVGSFLKEGLEKLEYLEIGDVRGSGLFLGVELITSDGKPNTQLAQTLKNNLRKKNILISTDGPYDNVLKIKPPLYFSVENALELLDNIKIIFEKQ